MDRGFHDLIHGDPWGAPCQRLALQSHVLPGPGGRHQILDDAERDKGGEKRQQDTARGGHELMAADH